MLAVNIFHKSPEMQDSSGIEYFLFEEDFISANIRCIPMIVRFKLDAVCIKLPLDVWCKFAANERTALAVKPCATQTDKCIYHGYLSGLIHQYTGMDAIDLKISTYPLWADLRNVPESLQLKAGEFNWFISIEKWKALSNLQRFALLKLFSPGHENKNFPKAMLEFGLAQ